MTAKAYLSQAMHIDQRINSKLAQLSSLRETAFKATATVSDMPRAESSGKQRLEATICRIVDLENEINEDIDRLVDLKADLYHRIGRVQNKEYQLVLELRYLCFKSWREIAEALGKEERYTLKLHGRALAEFEKVFPEVGVKDIERHS